MDPLAGSTGAIVLGVVALVFLLGLAFHREELRRSTALWAFLIGIPVLPVIALIFGLSATMDEAKEVRFCGQSCHVMAPFYEDLINPKSQLLAAVHNQNRFIRTDQCYVCHTGYSMFGPLKAKLAGVRHLWKYETGTYELPIKIVGTYNTGNCLDCHKGARKYEAQHAAFATVMESGEMTCFACHGKAHPGRSTRASE